MRRRTQIAALAAAAGLVLTSCGEAAQRSDSKETSDYPSAVELVDGWDPEAHLNVAVTAMPPSWDPIQSITNGDFNFYVPVYDRLLQTDAEGTPEPMLATSFEPSDDNSSMTLSLREGLTFSDGAPFDAEAVKFNLDRIAGDGSRISGEVNMITSVDVVDPMTVRINVDGGIGTLAVALTSRAGIMVSPAAVQAGTIASQPAGIGPYVATAINPGATAEFVKTENYWEPDAQRVASMTYSLIADDQARYNALVSGELDVALINPNQIAAAQRNGLNIVINESPLFNYLGINASVPPFDNPEVRKALNMAIDREGISQGLYEGHCTPGIQMFPESSPGYSDKIGSGEDIFPYDPEAAKKILEENGATGVQITSVPPNVTIYVQLAEAVQEQLAAVGITMAVKPLPPNELVQEFAIDKTAESLVSIATVINDPEAVHGRYITPTALFNPGKVDYGELNTAAHDAAAPLDPAERKPLYEKYWDLWVENPTHVIPICTVHLSAAARDNISGITQVPSGLTDLRGVAKAS